MLTLTRMIGKKIYIGDSIVVTLVAIVDGQAKIGIAAPAEVPVHREEVDRAIRRESPDGKSAPGGPKTRGK